MKKKQITALLMTVCMAASLLMGCSGGQAAATDGATVEETPASEESAPAAETDDAAAVETASDDAPVTLTVLAGQSTTDAGIEEFIDEALAAKYPNITLEWECVGWGEDFYAKIQQYRQSGMPDIIIGKAQDVGAYAPLGILGEIDSAYLDRGLDAARENVTFDGKTCRLRENGHEEN
ncbi:MAG: hypothetical protein Q4G60_15660 [bacterium]|nr:hypothetical protein [bacterium]